MRLVALAIVLVVVACGPGGRSSDGGDPTVDAARPIDAPGPLCIDGAHRCEGNTFEVCSGAAWQTASVCPNVCDESAGCVECIPGSTTCAEGNIHTCNADGTLGPESMACGGATVCDAGQCVDACADSVAQKSYIGCEYWAADLDNAVEVIDVQGSQNCSLTPGTTSKTLLVCANAASTVVAGLCDPPAGSCPSGFTCKSTPVCVLDAQHSPFAIVVSNPQARAVDVTVTGAGGTSFTRSVAAGQVAPLVPQAAPGNLPDQSLDGSGLVHGGYRVTSTLPIVAYQFNPLENVNVFSNDASLLIPRAAFDSDYYAMSWQTSDRRTPGPGAHAYHGYVSVVAWQPATIVEVTPSAAVRASATQPAIAAGVATRFTLGAFDVLTLEAAPGGDLTGSRIRAVDGLQTFGVFGGHEAAGFGESTPPDQTNTDGPCCADHLEDMLFPTSTWGKAFAVARSQSRMTNERDVIRVLAQKAGTTVTFDPAPSLGTCGTLAPGAFCEVKIAVDTTITASQPVLVGHYLESAIWRDPFFGGSVGSGDPSMAIEVPSEQFRTSYTVLVPSQYAKSYFSIAAIGATGPVTVDGVNIALTPFGSGAFRGARHQVTPGQHKLACPNGCGVMVYGYSDAVSYMFAGGLDLKQLVIE